MSTIVPPGGFAGFSQMTPASRAAWFRGSASRGSSRKKRKTRGKRVRAKTRRTRSSKRSGRLPKFGSAAWQKRFRVGRFAKKR